MASEFDPEPREAWLEVALGHLIANRGALRPGVLSMAIRLLRALECGPIPYPYIFVTGDGCYAIQWENVAGHRLSITVVREGLWRYAWREGRKSSGRQTVRGDHAERIREEIDRLFPAVNRNVWARLSVDLFSEGGWI
jgi:hypothetical protein